MVQIDWHRFFCTTLQTIFHLCIPKKDLAKFHLIFCREVQNYRCRHSAVSIGTIYFQTESWNFSSTGDSYFPIRTIHNYTDGPLNCLFSFLKYIFGIWEWGLANSFWDHGTQISIRQMNCQYIFSQLWKVRIFCRNIHSL